MFSLSSSSFYNLFVIIILYFLTDRTKSKRLNDIGDLRTLKWKSMVLKMGCLITHYVFFE